MRPVPRSLFKYRERGQNTAKEATNELNYNIIKYFNSTGTILAIHLGNGDSNYINIHP